MMPFVPLVSRCRRASTNLFRSREQITIGDDPAFDPFTVLPCLDLLKSSNDLFFRRSQGSTQDISQMTPLGSKSSQSSDHPPGSFGFDFPKSPSGISLPLPYALDRRSSSLPRKPQNLEEMVEFQPFAVEEHEEPSFIFDFDGNDLHLINVEEPELPPLPYKEAQDAQPGRVGTGIAHNDDGHIDFFGEGDNAFVTEPALPNVEEPKSWKAGVVADGYLPGTVETDGKVVKAKQRRAKFRLMLDQDDARISREEFRNWTMDYVQNMKANRDRQKGVTKAQAQKLANRLLYGNGLALVGSATYWTGIPHPLSGVFSGLPLEALLHGCFPEEYGKKTGNRSRRRKSDEAFDDEDEDRRVKPRMETDMEQGRQEQEDLPMFGDDMMPEFGMEGAQQMEDRHSSSMMPWSRPPSVGPGSSARAPSSAHKLGPAASPLLGRGKAMQSIERYDDIAGVDLSSEGFRQIHSNDSSFEFDGLIGDSNYIQGLDKQAQGGSLDVATQDFFDYALEKIEKGEKSQGLKDPRGRKWVDFEQLASPETHTRGVAAQAFLHVLSLATRGVVAVKQAGRRDNVPYGTIHVGFDAVDNVAGVDELA